MTIGNLEALPELFVRCEHCGGDGDEPDTDNDVCGPARCSVCHRERFVRFDLSAHAVKVPEDVSIHVAVLNHWGHHEQADLIESLSAQLAESEAARKRLEAELAECREALELSVLAIDDWLHMYASEHCNENDVARSRSRIQNRGGTLAYIAEVQQANRKALGIKPKAWGEVIAAAEKS